MNERDKVLSDIEHFMIDIFEQQKDLDIALYVDSHPKNMFKKKDYQARVDKFKELKNMALKIDTTQYNPDPDDEDLIELIVMFEETLALYNLYCDRGIEVQDMLRRRAQKEQIVRSEYMEVAKKQKATGETLTRSYNDLGIAYTDYRERLLEEEPFEEDTEE